MGVPIDGAVSLAADCLRYSTKSSIRARPLPSASKAVYVMQTSGRKVSAIIQQIDRCIEYLSCPIHSSCRQRNLNERVKRQLTFHSGRVDHTTCQEPKNLSSGNCATESSAALEFGGCIWIEGSDMVGASGWFVGSWLLLDCIACILQVSWLDVAQSPLRQAGSARRANSDLGNRNSLLPSSWSSKSSRSSKSSPMSAVRRRYTPSTLESCSSITRTPFRNTPPCPHHRPTPPASTPKPSSATNLQDRASRELDTVHA